MTILIISAYIPYPLDAGGNVAQYAVLEKMQHRATVTLCLFVYSDDQNRNADLLQEKLPLVLVKKIDVRFPSVPFKAPSLKKKIKNRISNFFSDVIPALAPIDYDEFQREYQISPIHLKNEKVIQGLAKILTTNRYDIVQLEYHEVLELVHLIPEHCKKVFVTVESKFLRLISAYKDSASAAEYKNYIIAINRFVESAMLKLFDAIIVFSDDDKKRLLEQSISRVYTIPYPVPDEEFKAGNKVKQIQKLIFVGGEGHAPNHDGLMWFIKECYPTIFARFQLPLHVVGRWNPAAFQDIPGVKMLGFVEDLDAEMSDSIMIVPIRIGNGIRTKILYGMAKKVPIITTTLGCEGIQVQDGKHISIADNAEDFFQKIAALMMDKGLGETLAENAFHFVDEKYRQENIVSRRMELYESLITDVRN